MNNADKLEQSQKSVVDTKAAYGAPYTTSYNTGIALVKYAAALDALLIDEGVAAYKETRSELQITSLINDTWQVEDDDMVWYQGILGDCQAYLKEQQDNE